MGFVSLTPWQAIGAAGLEQAGLEAFPPGTKGAGLDLGNAGAVWGIHECLMTLASVLLTAILASCYSSLLAIVLSSSSNDVSPEGNGRLGDEGPDSKGTVLGIGESHLALSSFILLMTILVSSCCGTAFPEENMNGALKE